SRLLAAAAVVGLLLLLFSVQGRLFLLVLISSLIPYAFTYEIPGGSEWRFTMHAYPFYMIASAFCLVILASAPWRGMKHLASDKTIRRSPAFVGSAVVLLLCLGWFSFNELNFLRKREAVEIGEAAMVESGQRDARFIGSGWYSPVPV